MKLAPEQFDALVEYINAKAAQQAAPPSDQWARVDRVVFAYEELENQLKGDQ